MDRSERFTTDADTVWGLISDFAASRGGVTLRSDSSRSLEYKVGATWGTWGQSVGLSVGAETPTSCVLYAQVDRTFKFSFFERGRQEQLLDEVFSWVRNGLTR